MAAGSDQERTEAPTEKRREDAKREGRIPRSPELTVAILLLGSALLLEVAGPAVAGQIVSVFGFGLVAVGSAPIDLDGSVALLREVGWRSLLVVAGFGGALLAMGLAVAGGQARGVLSGEILAPKWERLDPTANAKRVLGLQSWAELVKSLLKLLIVCIAVRGTLAAAWPDVMALSQQGPAGFVEVVQRYSVKLLVTSGICYLALAVLDYLWQVWRTERELMMSRDEIKQEMKQSEGDPLVKQRMRSFGRALARRQMMKAIPTADVVITNPTHIAIALKYDPVSFPAPVVVAMGERKVAERIKAIAKEHGVPTVENKPLARALLASCRVGTMIPGELYVAVAEILAFVFRRRMAAGKRLSEVYA